MTFADLLKQYRAGTLAPSDLEGITSEDFLKVRQEAGDGRLSYSLTGDALTELFAEDDKKQKPSGVNYVMVSDGDIPPFSDRVKASAWDLKQFKYRGSMVLYDHNVETSRPPIGSMSNVQKGVEMKRGGKQFKALTGTATFADKEVYPFAGMVAELVKTGLLRGGSIGFDVLKARPPTEEEQEQLGMRAYSTFIEKASPFEFSVTPLGRDQNAQRLSAETLGPLELKLAEFAREGIHDEDAIGLLREDLRSCTGRALRFGLLIPEMPSDEPAAVEPTTELAAGFAVSNFGVPDGNAPVGLINSTLGATTHTAPVTLTVEDKTARADIKEMRAELDDLREQLQKARSESIYSLCWGDNDSVDSTPEQTAETDASGSDSTDPLFLAAQALGFTA